MSGPGVRQCLTLIKTSLSDPALDVMMLSEELNIPRSTLSKQFVAKTGHSIGRYIRDQRLYLARHLLVSTTLPVGEIARRCGFSEFHQAFHGIFSACPAEPGSGASDPIEIDIFRFPENPPGSGRISRAFCRRFY